MFKIKCKCGKSEKSFHNNIGDFYIDTCCEEAGYDYRGNKAGELDVDSIDSVLDAVVPIINPIQLESKPKHAGGRPKGSKNNKIVKNKVKKAKIEKKVPQWDKIPKLEDYVDVDKIKDRFELKESENLSSIITNEDANVRK